jgi:prefoldin subunit 5
MEKPARNPEELKKKVQTGKDQLQKLRAGLAKLKKVKSDMDGLSKGLKTLKELADAEG